MAMNRETKRMLQRQGQLGPDGEPATQARGKASARTAPPRPAPKERVGPKQYLHEVRGELRKVAWPTRAEVVRYSVIVLITLIVLTAFIFALDFLFAKSVFFLFDNG